MKIMKATLFMIALTIVAPIHGAVVQREVKAVRDEKCDLKRDTPVHLVISPTLGIETRRALSNAEQIAKENGLNLTTMEEAEYVLLCSALFFNFGTRAFVGSVTINAHKLTPDRKRFVRSTVWEGTAKLKPKDEPDASAGLRALFSVYPTEFTGMAPSKK